MVWVAFTKGREAVSAALAATCERGGESELGNSEVSGSKLESELLFGVWDEEVVGETSSPNSSMLAAPDVKSAVGAKSLASEVAKTSMGGGLFNLHIWVGESCSGNHPAGECGRQAQTKKRTPSLLKHGSLLLSKAQVILRLL